MTAPLHAHDGSIAERPLSLPRQRLNAANAETKALNGPLDVKALRQSSDEMRKSSHFTL